MILFIRGVESFCCLAITLSALASPAIAEPAATYRYNIPPDTYIDPGWTKLTDTLVGHVDQPDDWVNFGNTQSVEVRFTFNKPATVRCVELSCGVYGKSYGLPSDVTLKAVDRDGRALTSSKMQVYPEQAMVGVNLEASSQPIKELTIIITPAANGVGEKRLMLSEVRVWGNNRAEEKQGVNLVARPLPAVAEYDHNATSAGPPIHYRYSTDPVSYPDDHLSKLTDGHIASLQDDPNAWVNFEYAPSLSIDIDLQSSCFVRQSRLLVCQYGRDINLPLAWHVQVSEDGKAWKDRDARQFVHRDNGTGAWWIGVDRIDTATRYLRWIVEPEPSPIRSYRIMLGELEIFASSTSQSSNVVNVARHPLPKPAARSNQPVPDYRGDWQHQPVPVFLGFYPYSPSFRLRLPLFREKVGQLQIFFRTGEPKQLPPLRLKLRAGGPLKLVDVFTIDPPSGSLLKAVTSSPQSPGQWVLEIDPSLVHSVDSSFWNSLCLVFQSDAKVGDEFPLSLTVASDKAENPPVTVAVNVLDAPQQPVAATSFEVFTFYGLPLTGGDEQTRKQLADVYALAGIKRFANLVSDETPAEDNPRIGLTRYPYAGLTRDWQWQRIVRHMPALREQVEQQHPWVKDASGRVYEGKLCPTWLAQTDAMQQWGRQLGGNTRQLDAPWLILDYEVEESAEPVCVCDRCLAGLTKSAPQIGPITGKSVMVDHEQDFTRYRMGLTTHAIQQIADGFHEKAPNARLILQANPLMPNSLEQHQHEKVQTLDNAAYDQFVDGHADMLYYPTLKYLNILRHSLTKLSKPVLPTVSVCEGPPWAGNASITPEELKLKIWLTAMAGAKGIGLWHGAESLDHADLLAIHEVQSLIAEAPTIVTAQGNDLPPGAIDEPSVIARLFKQQDSKLLALANISPDAVEFHINLDKPFQVKRAATDCKWSIDTMQNRLRVSLPAYGCAWIEL